MTSILIVDDDQDAAQVLQKELQAAGYQTTHARSVKQGFSQIKQNAPDLVLLDLSLPDREGRDFLVRLKDAAVRVVIITARDDVDMKVELLNLGANDHINKPYSLAELLARIAVQLRDVSFDVVTVRDLQLTSSTRIVTYQGQELHFTRKEFDILEFFMRHPGRTYSRAAVYHAVWGTETAPTSNIVEFHLTILRRKLRAAGADGLLRSIHRLGYALYPWPASTLSLRQSRNIPSVPGSSTPNTMPSILIVEDDPDIAESLQHDLQEAGYQTIRAASLRQCLTRARRFLPDLILLDLTLPGVAGLDVLLRLRRLSDAPVIVLKTTDTTYGKAELLSSGANDVILKPCHAAELLIRVSVHVRVLPNDVLSVRDFHLFPFARQVTCSGKPLHLSRREFDLLELFMRHPGQVFSREMIFEKVWGSQTAPTSNMVDTVFGRLRRKLEGTGVYILCTVRGVGYALDP